MMTPQQIDALHAMNDFMSETLLRLRTQQTRVTAMLAIAKQEHTFHGSDQERTEGMLSLGKIPYVTLPYEGTERADVCISTTFEGADESTEADYINVELQFDAGVLVGLRTLLGKAE